MPSKCKFNFDRPEEIYFSGDRIDGHILLTTEHDKEVRNITIGFYGEARVHWQEQRRQKTKSFVFIDHYRGLESYHTEKRVLPGCTLKAGAHKYEFSVQLPPTVPTSCVMKYGTIIYEVYLLLERDTYNNEFRYPVTVLRHLNLNDYPANLEPITVAKEKHFCCFPCGYNSYLSLKIPYRGYAPGQDIEYEIEMENGSKVFDVHALSISLNQSCKFKSHSPHCAEREIVRTLVKNHHEVDCPRNTTKSIKSSMVVPAIPPSNLREIGIITFTYFFKVAMKTGLFHLDKEFQTRLVIGTIPFADTEPGGSGVSSSSPPSSLDKPPSYRNFSPPSYEETVLSLETRFVDIDTPIHRRRRNFSPSYPMFRKNSRPLVAPPSSSSAPNMSFQIRSKGATVLPITSSSAADLMANRSLTSQQHTPSSQGLSPSLTLKPIGESVQDLTHDSTSTGGGISEASLSVPMARGAHVLPQSSSSTAGFNGANPSVPLLQTPEVAQALPRSSTAANGFSGDSSRAPLLQRTEGTEDLSQDNPGVTLVITDEGDNSTSASGFNGADSLLTPEGAQLFPLADRTTANEKVDKSEPKSGKPNASTWI